MRILKTILLWLLAALFVTAAVFLAVDGNLARLTGWNHYRPGDPLFAEENTSQLADVDWMRIQGLHDAIECERDAHGVWWITKPFKDRMSQGAVQAILHFTANTKIVDTLPLNKSVRANMREFGVETIPHTITLKVPNGKNHTTIARYTLGSASPWMADAEDGKNLLPTTYLRTNYYGKDKRIHVVTGNILGVFRNGLFSLRDPHPLLLQSAALRRISITREGEKKVILSRSGADSDWVIAAPILAPADQDRVDDLVISLSQLQALRVADAHLTRVTGKPVTTITLESVNGTKPVELYLYKPYFSKQDGQQVCHAKVSDRNVVFTLRAAPKVNRHGAYSSIIQSVYQLPVLDRQMVSQLMTDVVYTEEIPLSLDKLRSLNFAAVEYQNVGAISLRSKKTSPRFAGDRNSLLVKLIPGNTDGGIDDTWLVAADGQTYDAEGDIVRQFLSSLREVPAISVLEDIEYGADFESIVQRYGLHDPTYILMLAPRPCAYHALLYGHDLPLVREHDPRIFYVNRYKDPKTGESMWVGMEYGGAFIYKLSTKLTKLFSTDPNRWRQRNILKFQLSELRRLTLDYQKAPLVLEYDDAAGSWFGTLGGKDVSLNINPNRAEYYVRQLQRLKVKQWLPSDDLDAMDALEQPVFRVKLDLEITDYSELENVIADTGEDFATVTSKEAERWINEDDDDVSQTMRKLVEERKTSKETRTIEIAPMDNRSDKPLFYGRIKETGDVFILNFSDAQGLGSNPLDR